MRLLIVRHAKAFERDPVRWPDDQARPLTQEGEREFSRMARRLRRWLEVPDDVVSSGWSRAWRTAELLTEEAGWPAPTRCPHLEEGDEAGAFAGLLELIRSRGHLGALALVGHEPTLGRFAAVLLTGGAAGAGLQVRKGALLELEVDPDRPVGAALRTMVHPAVFAGKRRKRGR